ncbi:MAG: sulfate/molybdate ABC transporter ATP-binding protein [Acidothermaceae bacterium]
MIGESSLPAGAMALVDARLRCTRGQFELDVELRIPGGGVLALLGPNGAGKSTALQILAGLLSSHGSRVMVAGEVWDDGTRGFRRPTEERSVGVVFQDYLLFPRMSARDNVAFGLRARGVDKASARRQADDWLSRVGLETFGDYRPPQLSGGQAQRVAIARALATSPQLLLLDEPLAALDAGTRMHVRTDLRRYLSGFTGATVVVTHDALDALVLADQIVVVERGRVVQQGTPGAVAKQPRTRYVAQLVGLNLFRGNASDTTVTLDGGAKLTTAQRNDGDVFVVARPRDITVHREHPQGSSRNVWRAVVTNIEQHGDLVRLAAAGPPDALVDVTAEAIADLELGVGQQVWLSVKATALDVYAD